MTDIKTINQELQGQVLDTIRKSQETVVDAIKSWADTVQAFTPSLPAVPGMPFSDKLPKPSDLVANAYDFAGQLLASQRKFAEDVLAATAPVLGANGANGAPAADKKAGTPAK
jgi:hypothetical protein